ncbi:ACT domain-containing protein [Paraburkholderia flava]|uniref:ACT domain-containing protein n=1 Tax=Paraburkholderia flava TaxID=2547393 RepID=UPI00105CE6BE|nr:ACT domain-containing protein [Paraburkholderia flava]
MTSPISDLRVLLASMQPVLDDRQVAFVSIDVKAEVSWDPLGPDVVATFREREGLTLIVELNAALKSGVPILFRAAWITLTVHSDLEAVGLTAAFANALGAEGISCNVVAAAYHDHIFVPLADAQRAMAALERLQRDSAAQTSR